MSRFQNSIMDEWETFEFDYNLRNEHNNRGLIYGVPYGGTFDDSEEGNGGPVEIMINHNTNDENGLPVHYELPQLHKCISAELSM